jgi:hypothetical protein
MIVIRRTTAQESAAREGNAETRVCAVVIAHSACTQVLNLSSGKADWVRKEMGAIRLAPRLRPRVRGEDARP